MLSFCPSRSCAVARLRRQVRLQGQSYSALDAELCLWVYATGVEMVLDTYCAFCGQLSQPARARYYRDGKPLAELMGVNRHILPAAYGEFRSYYRDMLGRLVVGRMAREIAAAIFAAKLGPVPVSPLGPVIAAALMPDDRIREAYGLRWGWREQAIGHAFRMATSAAVRVAPPQASEWPYARVARQRFERATGSCALGGEGSVRVRGPAGSTPRLGSVGIPSSLPWRHRASSDQVPSRGHQQMDSVPPPLAPLRQELPRIGMT